MFHCDSLVVTTARLDPVIASKAVAPGILTAKTLQNVLLSARHRNIHHDAETGSEIVSPYGRMPRQPQKPRYRDRPRDSDLHHRFKHEVVVRRKRCRKLPAIMSRSQGLSDLTASLSGNQRNAGDSRLEMPDEQHIERLRSGLNQTSSKLKRDVDRLRTEIQWIHGHFPVLKLANAKCSRSLRLQLLGYAVVHVSINFMQRKALLLWYNRLLDVQRKERLQLSASRQLITIFAKVSFNRVAGKFILWRQWVLECQAQEKMAAAVTLQRFARFLRTFREERESAARQVALMKAFEELSRNAKTIQVAYHRHRQAVEQRRHEAAARKTQRLEMRRTTHDRFIKRQNATKLIQKQYRAYSVQRTRNRARAIAKLYDRNLEKNARCIQSTWRVYKSWRDFDLPVEIVRGLVDQVEFLDAVLSIQRHLRGFQCRFRVKKKSSSAVRIQKWWRAGKCRAASRAERQMLSLRRDLAASYLQRSFRRVREERNIRSILLRSTHSLSLRSSHLRESARVQFRLPVARSAINVIQTTWRRHVVYKKEKKRRLDAATTIQSVLKRRAMLIKWQRLAFEAPRCCQDEGVRTLQRWVRKLRHRHTKSTRSRTSVVYVADQVSAATTIQRWYRHYHCDLWRILLTRLLVHELPRCIEAVNQITRSWKAYRARKQERTHRASAIADLIERQRRSEGENRAARCIQRMYKRVIDQRDGKLLLQGYKILLRQDMKRKQQRVIVHQYLEEKSQQRKKKQESKAGTFAGSASLDSYTTEASAFSLDETPYDTNDNGWPEGFVDSASRKTDSSVQYWSDEYQRAYLYDPVTGLSTWL